MSEELHLSLAALGYAGFLVPDGESPTWRAVVWSVVSLLQLLVMNGLVLARALTSELSLPLATGLVSQGIATVQTLFRRVFFTLQRDRIADLVLLLQEPPASAGSELMSADQEMRANSTVRLRRFSSLVMGLNGVVAIIYILRAVFLSAVSDLGCTEEDLTSCEARPKLLFDVWWPAPLQPATLAYFFVLLWQLATLLIQVGTNTATDVFTCSLALAAAERSALLATVAPQVLMPGPGGRVTSQCRAWLRYHQRYIQIVSDLNSVMGLVFFTTYIMAGVNIISLSYLSVKMSDSRVLAGSMAVLGVVLLQLFTYAHVGQRILNKSEELARSTLGAAQVARGALKEGPARSVLLVLVTRLSGGIKPEQISGLGYFSISMEFFTKVLSASVSYLLVLLQLQP